MSKNKHTPIPRYREYTGPVLLTQGFRPFFLFAGIWAIVAPGLFLCMFLGQVELPTLFDPIAWHYHEMLYGFVAAAVAGFTLTAIPNWTGRLPLQGNTLLCLVLLWIAGRLSSAFSQYLGAWPSALIDISFLAALAAVTSREIVAGKNWRNLPIILAISLFLAGNILMHAGIIGQTGLSGIPQRFSITIVIALITLIGGRVIPSFTRNWLVKNKASHLPASIGKFDLLVILFTLFTMLCWTFLPYSIVTAGLAAGAAFLNLVRLIRWKGHVTYPEPLLLILHLSYLWIPIGLGLLASSYWWPAMTQTGALHALTAGAMGTMILAIMSRATLGHTGHKLRAGFGLTLGYGLIIGATTLRIFSILWADLYMPLLVAAALFWAAAFIMFLGVCGPILLNTRLPKPQPEHDHK